LKTEEIPANDDVIQEIDLKNLSSSRDALGDPQIGFRRFCGA
jgi:hypothetical protein